MAEQEDEEDKMRWRIEAEVRLALEAAQQAQAQREAHYQRELASLKVPCCFDFIFDAYIVKKLSIIYSSAGGCHS